MKTIILTLVTALISSNAIAEWIRIGEGADETSMYVHLTTLRKMDHMVKMWTLEDYKDFKELGEDKYLSSKVQWECDCKEGRLRALVSSAFSKNMGGGNVVATLDEGKWNAVQPESLGEKLWEIACDENGRKAHWVLVKTSPNTTEYIDPTTAFKTGSKVTIWELMDLKKSNEDPKLKGMSVKRQREYDCDEAKVRILAMMLFTGNMGIGKPYLSISNPPGEWYTPKPDSAETIIWEGACNR